MCAARVSFYVLGDAQPNARLGYACRLAEKVYKLQQRIHAHTADTAMAQSLDTLLWTFRQGSFVPHELLVAGRQPTAPITIGAAGITTDTAPPAADLLINLADDVPAFYAEYQRIAEIVDGTPAGRESGRARHRFYRDQGLELETHEVT